MKILCVWCGVYDEIITGINKKIAYEEQKYEKF